MPLLLTPATPFQTTAQLPVVSAYAIIDAVSYTRRGLQPKTLGFTVAYYANEAASVDVSAAPLQLMGLPLAFAQPATPEEISAAGDTFALMESIVAGNLTALLPGLTIETVD